MKLHKWATVVACMMAFTGPACAQAQRDDQKTDQQQQQTQTEHAKPGSAQPFVSGAPAQSQAADHRTAEAKVYEPDCRKPKDQPDADLCTQRRVADAAEEALQWALAQTVIGALGVAFVVVTLGFTARANKAAAIAAQAAVDAVGAERAWITAIDVPLHFTKDTLIDDVVHDQVLTIATNWKNGGRSPALKVCIYVSCIVSDISENDEEIPEFEDKHKEGHAIIGPGFSVFSQSQALFGDNFKRVLEREKAIFYYSKVWYSTTISPDNMVHSEACFQIIRNGSIINKEGVPQPNFEIRVVGRQNAAL